MSSCVVPPEEPGGKRNVDPEIPAASDCDHVPDKNHESESGSVSCRRNSVPCARPIELLNTAKSGVFSNCVVSSTLLTLRFHWFRYPVKRGENVCARPNSE